LIIKELDASLTPFLFAWVQHRYNKTVNPKPPKISKYKVL